MHGFRLELPGVSFVCLEYTGFESNLLTEVRNAGHSGFCNRTRLFPRLILGVLLNEGLISTPTVIN